jgi:hypothetical protein
MDVQNLLQGTTSRIDGLPGHIRAYNGALTFTSVNHRSDTDNGGIYSLQDMAALRLATPVTKR